jgi:hypothetical protein
VIAEPLRSIAGFHKPFFAIGAFSSADFAAEVAAVFIPPNTPAFIATEFLRLRLRFLNNELTAVLAVILVRFRRERLPGLDVMPPTIGFYSTLAYSGCFGDFREFRALFPHFGHGYFLNISHYITPPLRTCI